MLQHLGERASSGEEGHRWLFGKAAFHIQFFSPEDLCSYLIASSLHTPLQLRKSSQILVACVTQDAGPQMPSDVTNLVKEGSNVLQAIGEFSGNCLLCKCLFPCDVLGA